MIHASSFENPPYANYLRSASHDLCQSRGFFYRIAWNNAAAEISIVKLKTPAKS
jgi:hypothetical protein